MINVEELKQEIFKELEEKYYIYKKAEGVQIEDPYAVMNVIMFNICEFYNVNAVAVKGNDRSARLVHCRHLFFYITRLLYGGKITVTQMSSFINKHHSSAIHASKKITDYMEFEKGLSVEVETVINNIKAKL